MVLHQTRIVVIVIIITIFISSSTEASNSTCNHYCGTVRSNRTRVPYPFGFSAGCPIRLDCHSNGDIRIGEFKIQNFTTDYILIDLPAQCNRSIHSIKHLINHNFALTWRNNLLLQNCSSVLSGCMIPTSMMESRFQLQGCESRINESIRCYSEDYRGNTYMDYDNLTRTNCSVLFSSIAVDLNNGTNRNSAVSLEFQRLELGWWLNGGCRCVEDADCVPVSPAAGGERYRCRCKVGFDGDGFVDGDGCRKVSKCNASRYMSGRCGGTARVGVLIGGVIAGAVLMIAIALICFCIRRRSTSLKNQMTAKRLLCEAAGGSSIPFFPYKEIERATNGFSEKQRLGTGAYGTVYAGKLHSDDWVAIKKIRHRDAEGIEQVMNEIKLLSSVSHPNLVRLLGCCIENDEQVVDFSRPHSEINLAALAIDRIGKGRVDEIIDPFLDPNKDAWTLSSLHKVAELAFRCLAFHRDMRPTMTEVADELEQIRLSGWAPMEENICLGSSVGSSCSSPYNRSEKSFGGVSMKKMSIESRRLIVPQRVDSYLTSMEETKENSPVSVQDPWLSEQSSPSTNSLLGNVAR
ncbi:hypothetical protein LguiB_009137 [Lonicera macranthoides]